VASDGHWLWFDVTDNQKRYLVLLVVLIVMVMIAKNLARTRTGRALQAIRDRDVAAEVMGVPEAKYKLIAFAISSYFAGMAGALFASLAGKLPATEFDLFLSVTFIAIILIGGVGTVTGALLGTFFVVIVPEIVEKFTEWLAERGEGSGIISVFSDAVLTSGPGDFGPVSIATQTPGWPMNIFDWNLILYGVLIVVFLIFEPLGLFGIWLKIRNYWKGWPFSY
jgi:branched-chain amino acid transport system permease protein